MRNRRWAIVAGLGMLEIWIAGSIVRSIAGGGYESPSPAFARGNQTSKPGATTQTLESGSTPSVLIDDDAVLSVTVRPGATVAVHEQTRRTGWVHGADAALRVEKTPDGVRIVREGGLRIEFGSLRRQLDVVVPPQARLDVRNAGSTTVSGLRAAMSLHSDAGPIAISDHVGSVSVKSDNGRIALRDVVAPSVEISTDNGRVTFDRVRADHVTISADNGRIEVARSLLRGGKVQTDSGRISLGLDSHSDVTVRAQTSAGKVIAESPLALTPDGDVEGAPATVRVGNGAGRLDVDSAAGSITIFNGGA